ncbi:PREDICTED: RNA polymerase II-associated protein 3 isoform X2 [Bactrocera latifrons]|uniref:RNA polymerase II-associated protein 3 isoform X2 n=1 Tax=Bactrocera latifrons TaxID=174628 RepID=UPI0008DDC5A5|nr:PREDICTED: RNA polymerase II-associated protein 3 isoform X2 [Bactrocera latifrons]
MDALKKSHEIQLQVRNNAEETRNTLNDLYSWEQEMKAKEKELHRRPANMDKEEQVNVPIRSHVIADKHPAQNNRQQKQQQQSSSRTNSVAKDNDNLPSSSSAITPTEKLEKPLDANEEKRKQANEIKDKGNKYVKLGEYEKAINEYTNAIDIFPEDPIYFCNRALCYLKLERYNECIEDCEHAIEIDSLSVKAYYRRMQANECLGNDMDALKDCTNVLMIEPKNGEANKSLERINERLRKNVKSAKGPNFSAPRADMIDILPIDKPPYKRSNKPLRRVPIADVIGPKDTKNCENTNLKISDEDIDKLFNSNCGPFVEVKKSNNAAVDKTPGKPAAVSSKVTNKFNENQNTKDDQKKSVIEVNKSSATAGRDVQLLSGNRSLPPPPTSTAQFYSNWKELTPALKYKYLKSINVRQLRKVLGAGFDSDTLTDLLHTLRDFYLAQQDAATASTLLEISKNNQVGILSLLMSADERKIITDIVSTFKESKEAEQILKNFNLP